MGDRGEDRLTIDAERFNAGSELIQSAGFTLPDDDRGAHGSNLLRT